MNISTGVVKLLTLLHRNLTNVLIGIFFSVAVIKLLSLYLSVNTDDGRWEQFKTEHQCRLLVNDRGSQRLSWQCDNGKIYYRWRQQR